jgi:hypothetical protein
MVKKLARLNVNALTVSGDPIQLAWMMKKFSPLERWN